jgi:hypothetical protein
MAKIHFDVIFWVDTIELWVVQQVCVHHVAELLRQCTVHLRHDLRTQSRSVFFCCTLKMFPEKKELPIAYQ